MRAQFGPGPPEPEDVAQSAFMRFAAADPAHIENPRAFLYATARHLVIDHHRKAQRVGAHEQAAQSAAEDRVYELSPENVLLQAERFRILAQALERMPLKRRRLVLLNRFEGLSYAEIGEQFGMSAENVRKHIERTLAECLRALRGVDVHEEAAAWVAQLDGRAPAADERARFDDWLSRSPTHAAAYEDALRTWRDLAAMRGSEQYRALLGRPTLRERMVSALRAPRWRSRRGRHGCHRNGRVAGILARPAAFPAPAHTGDDAGR